MVAALCIEKLNLQWWLTKRMTQIFRLKINGKLGLICAKPWLQSAQMDSKAPFAALMQLIHSLGIFQQDGLLNNINAPLKWERSLQLVSLIWSSSLVGPSWPIIAWRDAALPQLRSVIGFWSVKRLADDKKCHVITFDCIDWTRPFLMIKF